MNIPRSAVLSLAALAAALAVGVRCVFPESDAYPELCFSAALTTDEGFYSTNAREAVLGLEPQPNWQNRTMMPVLHALQVGVFRTFGVGIVQARGISIVAGLLSVCVLFAALRRAHGVRVAVLGAGFLALDHFPALYGRLALMDPVAMLPMALAYLAFVRGGAAPTLRGAAAWFAGCGAAIVLAFGVRGLAALAAPGAVIAASPFFGAHGGDTRPDAPRWTRWIPAAAVVAGFAAALGVHAVVWGLPFGEAHVAHLVRDNLHPRDLGDGLRIVASNLAGGNRGMVHTLFEHMPVQVVAAAVGVAALLLGAGARLPPDERRSARFLAGTFLSMGAALFVARYNAGRYWLAFTPALCGFAAVTLLRLPALLPAVLASRAARALLASLVVHHTLPALVPGEGVHPLVRAAAALAAAAAGWYAPTTSAAIRLAARGGSPDAATAAARPVVAAAVLVFLAVNAVWYGDWIRKLSWRQREASEWIGSNLPADAVVFGSFGPVLCMHTRLQAVPVVGRWGISREDLTFGTGRPRYVAVLESRDRDEGFWREKFPQVVAPENFVRSFEKLRRPTYRIDLYRVP